MSGNQQSQVIPWVHTAYLLVSLLFPLMRGKKIIQKCLYSTGKHAHAFDFNN